MTHQRQSEREQPFLAEGLFVSGMCSIRSLIGKQPSNGISHPSLWMTGVCGGKWGQLGGWENTEPFTYAASNLVTDPLTRRAGEVAGVQKRSYSDRTCIDSMWFGLKYNLGDFTVKNRRWKNLTLRSKNIYFAWAYVYECKDSLLQNLMMSGVLFLTSNENQHWEWLESLKTQK